MANPKYAASEKPVPVAELVDTLSDGTKVKRRIPRMRACNEKDAKGKLCAGHLKRWYFFGDEVKQKFGADAEIGGREKDRCGLRPGLWGRAHRHCRGQKSGGPRRRNRYQPGAHYRGEGECQASRRGEHGSIRRKRSIPSRLPRGQRRDPFP